MEALGQSDGGQGVSLEAPHLLATLTFEVRMQVGEAVVLVVAVAVGGAEGVARQALAVLDAVEQTFLPEQRQRAEQGALVYRPQFRLQLGERIGAVVGSESAQHKLPNGRGTDAVSL